MNKEHQSDCCQAPVQVIGGDEGTNYWECEKCGKSCNDTYYCTPLPDKSINYFHVGKPCECGHCHPEKDYALPEKWGIKCECSCHDTVDKSTEGWERELDVLRSEIGDKCDGGYLKCCIGNDHSFAPIKAFISHLLSQKTEEVIKEIERQQKVIIDDKSYEEGEAWGVRKGLEKAKEIISKILQ